MNNKSPQATTHKEVIDKVLSRLAEAEQPLPSSLEFYRRILLAQNKIKLPDLCDISTELEMKAAQHLIQHKPVITFSDLKINWENIQQLLNELADLTV
ncbi:MAG: hypothetical protein JW732_07485, partial [Dehalococcoidia bacterium]|nr:hypothetical protein [Dehalococcoidia bacterium]